METIVDGDTGTSSRSSSSREHIVKGCVALSVLAQLGVVQNDQACFNMELAPGTARAVSALGSRNGAIAAPEPQPHCFACRHHGEIFAQF